MAALQEWRERERRDRAYTVHGRKERISPNFPHGIFPESTLSEYKWLEEENEEEGRKEGISTTSCLLRDKQKKRLLQSV